MNLEEKYLQGETSLYEEKLLKEQGYFSSALHEDETLELNMENIMQVPTKKISWKAWMSAAAAVVLIVSIYLLTPSPKPIYASVNNAPIEDVDQAKEEMVKALKLTARNMKKMKRSKEILNEVIE